MTGKEKDMGEVILRVLKEISSPFWTGTTLVLLGCSFAALIYVSLT